MTVRHKMTEWCATSARSATRVTSESCPCLSRFSRQFRPSRLSQASAIVVEALMNTRAKRLLIDTSPTEI
jgi:hypothetical protein